MSSSRILLEVCVDSVAGASAAQRGGADRIELCSGLAEGGITPSAGLIRAVVEATSLPVMVMIRPRGGSFVYSASEFAVMQADIEFAKTARVSGVVFGVLDHACRIDLDACRQLVDLARPLLVTFHRAIDAVQDIAQALEALIELQVERVLTSGQAKTVVNGLENVARMVDTYGREISIMPGAGVRPENAREIIRQSGATEIHGTASEWVADVCHDPRSDRRASSSRRVTSEHVVRLIRQAIDQG